MIDEIKKSINSVLFERVTSPLYGTFICTWLIWNWKIVYLTLFISEKTIQGSKIDFIVNNYSNVCHLVWGPLISTIVLISIIPFASNGSYWLHMWFKQWKVRMKNKLEDKQLLNFEQSVAIRLDLKNKEIEFEKLILDKENEIGLLKTQISELESQISSANFNNNSSGSSYGINDYIEFKANSKVFDYFESIVKSIKENNNFPEDIPADIKEYYLINEIIKKKYSPYVKYDQFNLTHKGELIYKEHFNKTFNAKK